MNRAVTTIDTHTHNEYKRCKDFETKLLVVTELCNFEMDVDNDFSKEKIKNKN